MLMDVPSEKPIRVLLADDHRMILEVFALFLTESGNMEVTTAETFDEAADLIQSEGAFDVVLLDLHMPGMNGVAGLRRAIRLNEGKPVAIITGTPTPRMQDEIMKAGASGIVLKTTPVRSLANAIRFMQSGERYLPMELMRLQSPEVRMPRQGHLSDKEMEVLNFLAEGKPNKEIAKELQLAEPTVKMHVTSIYRKFDVQNRTQAVVVARDMGLV
ncbi:response regulator [Paracoccus sp. NSM]|uniref:response regulator n=1 Tax=Paracoccus sp. NSM TaxID=3457784 RepID=UPI004035347B